jgi:hypothetical protein
MTNHRKAQTAAAAAPNSWLFPPVLVPILLTLMIGARVLYLALLS